MTTPDAIALPPDDRRAYRNVAVLAAAAALAGATPAINIAAGPLAGYALLGDDKSLATLPVAAFVFGTACGTVPAALLMRRIGRRPGFVAGMLAGAIGALLQAAAIFTGSFALLCLGSFLLGGTSAFTQQFRFAAVDTASEAFRPRAISYVLLGGVAAAVIGPQAVIHLADWFAQAEFAGAFAGASILALAAAGILLFLDIPLVPRRGAAAGGRPIGAIARQPDFVIAVGCATAAFAVMAFVMTAAPLAMVMHDHGRDAAVLGIQWHVLAMFAPSLFTGALIVRFGVRRVVVTGLTLLLACALIALSGTGLTHFWGSLILLGLGWNLAFIGGTAMVTLTYRPEEKEKVQALNDFVIFGFVALASLLSGGVLQVGGWSVVNVIVLPITAACILAVLWQGSRSRRPA